MGRNILSAEHDGATLPIIIVHCPSAQSVELHTSTPHFNNAIKHLSHVKEEETPKTREDIRHTLHQIITGALETIPSVSIGESKCKKTLNNLTNIVKLSMAFKLEAFTSSLRQNPPQLFANIPFLEIKTENPVGFLVSREFLFLLSSV